MISTDPQPFVYRYPSGRAERRATAPITSRVGWCFKPREGFSQNLNDYTEQQRKYA